ncbi:MAG TPA: hypothetical protein VJ890_05925 [Vineibacter sp.]|nr:hypothetical protein [Vineibacter sp.]
MTAAEKRALAARLRALALVPTQGGHNADRALLLRAQQLEYEADQQERES